MAKSYKLSSGNYIDSTGIVHNKTKLSDILTYSTEEKKAGTWIDGKPIYRKVINFGALPNATTKSVAHNISNLNSFIRIDGIADRGDGFYQSIPMVYRLADNAYNTGLMVENQYVRITTDQDRSSFNGYVILEYTKTTD